MCSKCVDLPAVLLSCRICRLIFRTLFSRLHILKLESWLKSFELPSNQGNLIYSPAPLFKARYYCDRTEAFAKPISSKLQTVATGH